MPAATPSRRQKSQAGLYLDHEILVQCVPMKQAQDIAQTLLNEQGNEVQMSQGSRVLRVRATDKQYETVRQTIGATRKSLGVACETAPP